MLTHFVAGLKHVDNQEEPEVIIKSLPNQENHPMVMLKSFIQIHQIEKIPKVMLAMLRLVTATVQMLQKLEKIEASFIQMLLIRMAWLDFQRDWCQVLRLEWQHYQIVDQVKL